MIYGELKEVLARHGIVDTYCGSEVGHGWISIIDDMLERMIARGWNKDLSQIKSKFCQLRVYYGCTPDMADDLKKIVEEAEGFCNISCEECGKLHNLVTPRSGRAECTDCKKTWKEREEKRWEEIRREWQQKTKSEPEHETCLDCDRYILLHRNEVWHCVCKDAESCKVR